MATTATDFEFYSSELAPPLPRRPAASLLRTIAGLDGMQRVTV